jgi:hypothetical protein
MLLQARANNLLRKMIAPASAFFLAKSLHCSCGPALTHTAMSPPSNRSLGICLALKESQVRVYGLALGICLALKESQVRVYGLALGICLALKNHNIDRVDAQLIFGVWTHPSKPKTSQSSFRQTHTRTPAVHARPGSGSYLPTHAPPLHPLDAVSLKVVCVQCPI